ncbi:MAG: hypothetical protein HYX32_03615 [Actinobacteria bacterium]|nr:hypothetical protein [Actinomycetota bacterium]
MPTNSVLLDDRLLVERITGAKVIGRSRASIHTTTYWYYRACRAAVLGASRQLSGPFEGLDELDQSHAIAAMLRLPDDIGLPDPRPLVPAMVDIVSRHPMLNLMNIEAAATATLLRARVLLSPPAAQGVLAPVLDAEGIVWDTVDPAAL